MCLWELCGSGFRYQLDCCCFCCVHSQAILCQPFSSNVVIWVNPLHPTLHQGLWTAVECPLLSATRPLVSLFSRMCSDLGQPTACTVCFSSDSPIYNLEPVEPVPFDLSRIQGINAAHLTSLMNLTFIGDEKLASNPLFPRPPSPAKLGTATDSCGK